MKYAFMTFSTPELTLADCLATAQRYGYDAIEPRIDANHKHGIERDADASQRAAARDAARDSGIALCCIATSCRYADPATAEEDVAATLQAIDLAADVGAPCIRVFGGMIPDGISRDDAVATLVQSMNAVAPRAAERGVTVCMETHDAWCDPADLARVISTVAHPNIAVNWDIMHPVRVAAKTMDEAFDALRPWIRHVHCHDGRTAGDKLELTTIGDGIIDHKRALELLASLPFDGYVSGEWINWQPYEEHLPRELAILKDIEAAMS